MPSLRVRGRRLHLTHPRRTKGGKVETLYLGSWKSLQEAEIDLSDARVVAAIRNKIGASKFEPAELLIDLKRNPDRYVAVPRYSTELAMLALDRPGRVEWDLGRGFWRELSQDIVVRMGLSATAEVGGFWLANPQAEIRNAVGQFQVDVEAASRDLQARLRKMTRKYATSGRTRSEIEEAMATLQLGGPIEKLTIKDVKRQFGRHAKLFHPDAGGSDESFINSTHARDILVRYLESVGRS